MFPRNWTAQAEISDLIVSYDPETLTRQPVQKWEVLNYFRTRGNAQALRVVDRLPARDGILDPGAVDRLLIHTHCEMQRISEEFVHGRRVNESLGAMVTALFASGLEPPLRVVDIGCGTGYVMRWLAGHLSFSRSWKQGREHLIQQVVGTGRQSPSPTVRPVHQDDPGRGGLGGNDPGGVWGGSPSELPELIGVDYNAALVAEASRLAKKENLNVRFEVANAFRLERPAHVFISTGVLHHFRGDGLTQVFREHQQAGAAAFLHFDFQPSWHAPMGSWLFHAVRMREPLAKHDGVLSAVRAHSGSTLVNAARTGAPEYAVSLYSANLWGLPVPRSFHTLVGVKPEYKDAFIKALGPLARRLGPWK